MRGVSWAKKGTTLLILETRGTRRGEKKDVKGKKSPPLTQQERDMVGGGTKAERSTRTECRNS